jgi:hypothetical protein
MTFWKFFSSLIGRLIERSNVLDIQLHHGFTGTLAGVFHGDAGVRACPASGWWTTGAMSDRLKSV